MSHYDFDSSSLLLEFYKARRFACYTKERHRAAIAEDVTLLLDRPDLLRPIGALRILPETLNHFACPDDLTTYDKMVTISVCAQEEKSYGRSH